MSPSATAGAIPNSCRQNSQHTLERHTNTVLPWTLYPGPFETQSLSHGELGFGIFGSTPSASSRAILTKILTVPNLCQETTRTCPRSVSPNEAWLDHSRVSSLS